LAGDFCLTIDPQNGSPGYFLLAPVRFLPSRGFEAKDRQLSALELIFDGYSAGTAQVSVQLQSIEKDLPDRRVQMRVPPTGARHVIAVTPGTYRVWTFVHIGSEAPVFSDIRRLAAGESVTLHYGNRFSAKMNVLWWRDDNLCLWFDIADNRQNCFLHFPDGAGALVLRRDGQTLFDGSVTRSGSRWIEIERPWGRPRDRAPLEVEYRAQSSITGPLRTEGTVLPGRDLLKELSPTYRALRFEVRCRENAPESGKRVAEALEAAHTWLEEHYAGPVRPFSGDHFEVHFALPVGVGSSGGTVINTQVYSANSLAPMLPDGFTRVLFHEFGHSYEACPPHHQARKMGGTTCESQATMIADYCMGGVIGPRAFHWSRQEVSARFFNTLMSPTKAKLSEANRMEFVLHYIDARFGQAVNRDFFRALYASESNCEGVLLSADFLTDEHERSASMYSFLTGENLAWLWRWADFDVSDEKVGRAMSYFKEQGALRPSGE